MNLLKVKAGALQFTLFVVVVIALLLVSFIILVKTQKQFNIQTNFTIETVENAQKGIEYVIRNNISYNDTVHVNLKNEDYKTLKVHRDYWGIFEKVVSVSKIKHNNFKKTALLGASQPKLNRAALYVKDNNKPLVVVGDTKIKGVAYIPQQGVRTGNISGHSYYGNQLIYGETKTSKTELPKLLNETINQIKNMNLTTKNLSQNQFLDLNKSKTYQNSFFNPLQLVYSNISIILSEVSLTGHIIVQSQTKIIVDSSSKLKDVILIAPEIEIKNNVKGTFQAFATNTVSVGENCLLNYPSTLIIVEKEALTGSISNNKKENQGIEIGKGSTIKGIVAYLGIKKTNNFDAQITIGDDVTVIGEVYCNQNTELKGAVFGSVFTSNFVAKQSGSIYQNHIYNGTINVDNLPIEYAGLLFETSNKGVVKWMY